MEIRTINVTRYVTPLREGGSLPAIVEADDQFLYVLKFRGAGQGSKALIAEFIGCELARTLGFKVPELVFGMLGSSFGRIEGDEEIQDLLKASVGLNLGIHFLSGAITFDPVTTTIDPLTASKIVWFDSLIMNVDRTARNTNMLTWRRELWLIDHGASFYFHHSWSDWNGAKLFPKIKDHVLLPLASELAEADTEFKNKLSIKVISDIVSMIPAEWLANDSPFTSDGDHRNAYIEFLSTRISQSHLFVKEASDARRTLI